MLKVRPIGDKILAMRIEEEKTAGGIVVPDTAKEKPQRGKVMAVGSGKVNKRGRRAKPVVKEGDVVLFGKYSGDEWSIDRDNYLFLSEDEILAIL